MNQVCLGTSHMLSTPVITDRICLHLQNHNQIVQHDVMYEYRKS